MTYAGGRINYIGRATTPNHLIIKNIRGGEHNQLIISDLRRRGHKVAAATGNGRHSQLLDYQHITQSNQ